MEFTDYMIWKLVILCGIAFLLGAFGLLPEQQEKRPPDDTKRIE